MSVDRPTGGAASMPEVFDQIADAARDVQRFAESGGSVKAPAGSVRADARSSDGLVFVEVVDGRVSSIQVDPYLETTTPWGRLERMIREVVNSALEAYEVAGLDALKKVNTDFGVLVDRLGGLQSDAHEAFLGAIRRLGSE